MKIISSTLFCLVLFLCISCAGKKTVVKTDSHDASSEKLDTFEDSLRTVSFYELEETRKEIESKLIELNNRIENYEYIPLENEYTKKLQQAIANFQYHGEGLNHEIKLKDGSTIVGTIIKDHKSYIEVKTNLGKLIIEKENLADFDKQQPNEIYKPKTTISFFGSGTDKFIGDNTYVFKGQVINDGDIRADFIRVTYNIINGENLEYITSGSAFIDDGKKIVYESGVISDTALEPNKIANYQFKINSSELKSVCGSQSITDSQCYYIREINCYNENDGDFPCCEDCK